MFLLFILCSCSFNQNVSNKSALSSLDSATQIIPMEVDDLHSIPDFVYSKSYSNVKYVNLECTPESAIGKIATLEITNDNNFVVFDRKNGKICLFDSLGNYINQIGHRGRAANEYITPEAVAYDKYSNQVVVYDNATRKLIKFDLKGNVVSIVHIKDYIANFEVVDSLHYILFMNHRENLRDGEIGYNLKIIDKKGNIVNQFDSYKKDKMNFRPISEFNFSHQMNNLFFKEYFSSMIYQVSYDKLVPLYFLDYKEKNLSYDNCEKSEDVYKIINRDKSIFCQKFFKSNGKFIVNLVEEGTLVLNIQEERNPTSRNLGCSAINDIFGIVSTVNIVNVHKGKVYFSIDPSEIQDMAINIKKNRFEGQKEYRKGRGAETTNEDINFILQNADRINPIIQICTLK